MQTFYLMATDMGLGGCAIGIVNIDLFSKMTGIDFHVEGPVGQFAMGRGIESRTPPLLESHPPTHSFVQAETKTAGSRDATGAKAYDRLIAPPTNKREQCTLRIQALEDPVASRHLNWALENLAATILHTLHSRINVGDIEVVDPGWR
jgi:hypothetical protein